METVFVEPQSGYVRYFVGTEAAMVFFGSPRLFQRMLKAGWIKPVRQGGRGCGSLFKYSDLLAAAERYAKGEEPPLLPCELKRYFNPTSNKS